MKNCIQICVGVILAMVTLTTHAKPTHTEPATVEPATIKKAKRLFESADAAYRSGDYANALVGFKAALALVRRPSIILNIAQCYRQLDNKQAALDHYELYLEEYQRHNSEGPNPDRPPPYAEEVHRYIAQLRAALIPPPEQQPVDRPNDQQVTPQREPPRNEYATIVLLGTPLDASVYLDGELVARARRSRTRVQTTPGLRDLVVTADGYAPWKTSVDLTAGKSVRYVLSLEKETAAGSAKPWLVAGIATTVTTIAAEALAIVSTVKANNLYTDDPAFDRYKLMAIGGHTAAGVSAIAAIACWWVYASRIK